MTLAVLLRRIITRAPAFKIPLLLSVELRIMTEDALRVLLSPVTAEVVFQPIFFLQALIELLNAWELLKSSFALLRKSKIESTTVFA